MKIIQNGLTKLHITLFETIYIKVKKEHLRILSFATSFFVNTKTSNAIPGNRYNSLIRWQQLP